MRRLLLPIALALSLGSCASTINGAGSIAQQAFGYQATQKAAGEALAGYELVQVAGISYLQNHPCQLGQTFLKNGCREAGTAALINAALDKGDAAAKVLRDDLVAANKNNGKVGIVKTAISAVVAATVEAKAAVPTKPVSLTRVGARAL